MRWAKIYGRVVMISILVQMCRGLLPMRIFDSDKSGAWGETRVESEREAGLKISQFSHSLSRTSAISPSRSNHLAGVAHTTEPRLDQL